MCATTNLATNTNTSRTPQDAGLQKRRSIVADVGKDVERTQERSEQSASVRTDISLTLKPLGGLRALQWRAGAQHLRGALTHPTKGAPTAPAPQKATDTPAYSAVNLRYAG
jgi:hypothetical protein